MTQQQFDKLCKCHLGFSLDDNCVEEVIDAKELLTVNRFDIYAILIYIDHKVKGVSDLDFATSVYKERTRSLTSFKFSEDGNNKKNTFEDYVETLNLLIESFQYNTFDFDKYFIPVDKDYTLIDGAHRVACSIYFNKKIKILRFIDLSIVKTNYLTLISNLLPQRYLDVMAFEATKWHDNLFMLFIWPKAYKDVSKLDKAFCIINNETEVMYHKDLNVTYNAIRNLMIQIYGHMNWIGNVDNDFGSTYEKADEVWDEIGKCRIILVKAKSCEFILSLKAKVRKLFGIGLASMHSTDNLYETKLAAEALLNENSFHFISRAKPTTYIKSYKIFEEYKTNLINAKQALDEYIIDSSMVLALYGVREANDLDYYTITSDAPRQLIETSEIELHDISQSIFYSVNIHDLIYVPKHHFYFNGVKLVCLFDLLQFKRARYNRLHDGKDKNDIKLIELLLKDGADKWKMRYYMFIVKLKRIDRKVSLAVKRTRNAILIRLGLYDRLKQLFLRIKEK